jgi:hypothetical protein
MFFAYGSKFSFIGRGFQEGELVRIGRAQKGLSENKTSWDFETKQSVQPR